MNANLQCTEEITRDFKKTSQFRETLRRLRRNRGAMIGLVILLIILAFAIFADVLFDYETMVEANNIPERLIPPCWEHPFGTDQFGRDMLARVVHGSRLSLTVSACSVTLSLLLGGLLGAVAGFFGGIVDNIIMRVMDIVMAIPMTMFAIVIVAALGTSTVNLIIALGISSVPLFARVVRSAVLTVRDVEYIEAARAIGAKSSTIILKHILPNCMAPIIVQVTLRMASAIYNTSALSFLGMGVSVPSPEWGALLANGRNFIGQSGYLCVIPGLVIMLTILSLNMLGDGLRDALDPRLK